MLWRTASHAAIQIGPSCLRVAIVAGGRMLRSDSSDLPTDLALGAWEQALEPLDTPLREALDRLGVRGNRPAIVLHHRDAPAEIRTSDRSDFETLARQLMDERDLDFLTDGAGVRPVGRAGPQGRASLVHADAEARLSEIRAWLGRCGCRCVGVVGARSLALARVARRASEVSATAAVPVGVALLDEFQTAFAIARDGVVLGAEAAPFGWHDLADAMLPENTRDGDRPMLLNQMRAHLFECGAPGSASVLADLGERIGRSARSLAEPVAEKYAQFIAQTMEACGCRGGLTVHIDGSGAALAGLADYLKLPSGSEIEVCPQAAAFDPADPAGKGSLLASASKLHRELGLLPAEAETRRAIVRARIASATGACIAVGICGLYANHADRQALAMTEEMHASAPELARLEQRSVLRDRAAEIAAEIVQMRARLDQLTEGRVSWAGLLHELALQTPAGVRLVWIRSADEPGVAIASGVLSDPDSGANELEAFADGLSRSPLIASAVLEAGPEAGDHGVRWFGLRIGLAPLGSVALAEEAR